MLARMRTGTKVLLGFAFALAVAVVVGLIGYSEIRGISAQVDELGMQQLPSVQSLLEIRVGSERIKRRNAR